MENSINLDKTIEILEGLADKYNDDGEVLADILKVIQYLELKN